MYRVVENREFNSHEVYFDGKPSEEVRTNLKALKMSWNPKKGCWYGFAAEHEIIHAINEGGEAVVTDGYMGGGAYHGAKSHNHLYGSDLSKAIRAELKAEGIKGCTVSCKTYSMGQHLYVKVKPTLADMTPWEEYLEKYRVEDSGWIYYLSEDGSVENIYIDRYCTLDEESREKIRRQSAEWKYNIALNGENINQYHIDTYSEFSSEFIKKLERINSVVNRFRYDESNSMVDYFDTNFYYDIETKAVV